MKDLSIAVVNWNTCDYLGQCLASVYRAAPAMGFEVIVVDNASTDGSADMVENRYSDAILIRNRLNLGFAAGVNIAFKHSSGRYFLLLNTDTVILGDALDSMAAFMDSRTDAGAVGCKLLNRDGTLQRSCSPFPSVWTELLDALYLSKLFPGSPLFGCYAMTHWNFASVRTVDFAGGSCLMVRREAVEQIGLLDEGYFMFTEEADWCLRVWADGWKVYYYPDAQVVHYGGASTGRYGGDILLQLYISRNRFITKYDGRLHGILHRWILALGAILRMTAWGVRSVRSVNRDDLRAGIGFQRRLLAWAIRGSLEPAPRLTPEGAR